MSNNLSQSYSQSQVLTRSLMRNVYLWMTIGLSITGIVAWGTSQSPTLLASLSGSGAFIVLFIAQIGLVFFLSAQIMKMSPMTATLCFAAYAILNGLTMSYIFLAYTSQSIASTFFITAGMFGIMSVFAFTTKTDLSSWRNYLFMGLIGIVIASLVNMFLRSDGLSYIISYAGVVLFLGLTAYDTQKIKQMSDEMSGTASEPDYVRLSIIGALKLYLDFINLFLFLLRILGGRRS